MSIPRWLLRMGQGRMKRWPLGQLGRSDDSATSLDAERTVGRGLDRLRRIQGIGRGTATARCSIPSDPIRVHVHIQRLAFRAYDRRASVAHLSAEQELPVVLADDSRAHCPQRRAREMSLKSSSSGGRMWRSWGHRTNGLYGVCCRDDVKTGAYGIKMWSRQPGELFLGWWYQEVIKMVAAHGIKKLSRC
jgi:hypothetical protein